MSDLPLPEPSVARVGDMGEGTQLVLFKENDGDIIVCVTPVGHKFGDPQVQFCTPGSGGGSSPRTHAALLNLWAEMRMDAAGRHKAIDSLGFVDADAKTAALEAECARLREALSWIARVNAMDYEYQRVAQAALRGKDTK